MAFKDITPPSKGAAVTISNGALRTPDQPIIPFIRGDGTGPDIWRASQRVLDAAVEKAYGGTRAIQWFEVFAGQAAKDRFDAWLPEDTLEAFREFKVGIKGPLTTPVGGGIRSLNVALRQILDLYCCVRPVRHFTGVPSPVKRPEDVDMVIFRENTEDIYAGIEFKGGSPESQRTLDFLRDEFPDQFAKVRFGSTERIEEYMKSTGSAHGTPPVEVGIGIKPVSAVGTVRLVKSAIEYAIAEGRKSVTIVHKGNIMKFTEGAFRDWGYGAAERIFGDKVYTWAQYDRTKEAKGQEAADAEQAAALDGGAILVKDAIADIALQQVLTRPRDFEVIATLNLNGDYLSDALAAQVGGIGIAPGGNINYTTGSAIFEATHGTAPKYAGLDRVNPGSVILSGEMMLRYLGWKEAAQLVIKGLEGAIASGRVTYDFARLRDDATEIKCSEFGENIVDHMS